MLIKALFRSCVACTAIIIVLKDNIKNEVNIIEYYVRELITQFEIIKNAP